MRTTSLLAVAPKFPSRLFKVSGLIHVLYCCSEVHFEADSGIGTRPIQAHQNPFLLPYLVITWLKLSRENSRDNRTRNPPN